VRQLRRGLTLAQRQKLRTQVLERQLSVAYRRAIRYGLSETCRQAMDMSAAGCPARAAELHASCKAEEPGGTGCLCPCHDARDTAVVSGSAPLPALPRPGACGCSAR
jgi:hypothetical protein